MEDGTMPGLVINTNVASINGQRHLFRSSGSLSKALERLSSGLRINRAGDDAAGLAISENLRSQVRGLNMAARNAGDGISLIQTAEGAINTYTEIIQRMRELSIQSASDVNSAQNRAAIQLEVDAQLEELQRIATTLNFNGLKLFDGTFTTKKIQVGADYNQSLDIDVGDLRTNQIGAVANRPNAQSKKIPEAPPRKELKG
jgi:flagellin